MSDVKSTIYQRGDGQMIVTTGPKTCCFGSKRTAAEFIAMCQEELLSANERLAAAGSREQKLHDLYDELARDRNELRGAMAADDERLRLAAARVGIVAGCDTPDEMADEIERLRALLRELYAHEINKYGRWTAGMCQRVAEAVKGGRDGT